MPRDNPDAYGDMSPGADQFATAGDLSLVTPYHPGPQIPLGQTSVPTPPYPYRGANLYPAGQTIRVASFPVRGMRP